jgi:hypothetical protein
MKNLVRLSVLAGIISLACWGYPSSVAAFPMTCGSTPACSLTGEACTREAICCVAGLGFFACPCVSGNYQCNL